LRLAGRLCTRQLASGLVGGHRLTLGYQPTRISLAPSTVGLVHGPVFVGGFILVSLLRLYFGRREDRRSQEGKESLGVDGG
jgi:hypothetical protein